MLSVVVSSQSVLVVCFRGKVYCLNFLTIVRAALVKLALPIRFYLLRVPPGRSCSTQSQAHGGASAALIDFKMADSSDWSELVNDYEKDIEKENVAKVTSTILYVIRV